MTETLEKKMKNNSLLMWLTLVLIIIIQISAWDFYHTPTNTLNKVVQVQEDIIRLTKSLETKTVSIENLTKNVSQLKNHIKTLENNQKVMLYNQSLVKQKLNIGEPTDIEPISVD